MIKIKNCRYGPMLYLENDKWTGRSFDLYGEAYQKQIWRMESFIEEGDLIFFDRASMQRVLKRNLLKTLAFTSVLLAGATTLVNDIYRDWEGPYCDLKQLKNPEEAADGVSEPGAEALED